MDAFRPTLSPCIWVKGDDPIAYIDNYYRKESYLNAYDYAINPVSGVDHWPIKNAPIQPPTYKKQHGRPKMVRRREEGEEPPARKVSATNKMPRSRYVTCSCTICGDPSHNKRTCSIELTRKTREGSIATVKNNGRKSKVNVTVD
ncbi:hypothetical protein M0R45_019584 [Rubus argutus]